MDETPILKKSIVFEGANDAPIFPVSGAWGGLAPTGNSIVVSFYQAQASLPNVIAMEGKGSEGFDPNKGTKVTHGDITHRVMVTLVMTPEDCRGIATWLLSKSDEAARVRASRQQKGNP